MKNLLTSLLMFLSIPAFASDGGTEGHGGDAYTIEFRAAAMLAAQTLKKWQMKDFAEVDLEKLQAAIRDVLLVSKATVEVNGIPKSAANYPETKTIAISQTDWNSFGSDLLKKMQIALHEYFGILGIEYDNDTRVSSRFFVLFSVRETLTPADHINKKVALLREQFKIGKIPTSEELRAFNHSATQISFSWQCSEYGSLSGLPSVSLNSYSYIFEQRSSRSFLDTGTGFQKVFSQNNDSLLARFKDVNESWLEAIRMNGDGDLVIEVSNEQKYPNQQSSIQNPGGGAVAYRICSLFDQTVKLKLSEYILATNSALAANYSQMLEYAESNLQSEAMKNCLQKPNRHCDAVETKFNQIWDFDPHPSAMNEIRRVDKVFDSWTKSLSQERAKSATSIHNAIAARFLNHYNSVTYAINARIKNGRMTCLSISHQGKYLQCLFSTLAHALRSDISVMQKLESEAYIKEVSDIFTNYQQR